MAMLSSHWHEFLDVATGNRVRVDGQVKEKLSERAIWQAFHQVRAKNLPPIPKDALMGRGCFVTVRGLELFGTMMVVKGIADPPHHFLGIDAPVIHLATKERFLIWQKEMEERNRQKNDQSPKRRRRRHKVVTPGPAPLPNALGRVGIIRLQWGNQIIEIVCISCSLRWVRFGAAGLELPCLHCLGAYIADWKQAPTLQVRPFLVPIRYVIGLEAGPSFQLKEQLHERADVFCFEPTQGAPDQAMTREDIEHALADLFDPASN